MKIICLVENTSDTKLVPVHGLSFYIETVHHKILFDLGPDKTIIENASLMNIDLSKVDIVIISHGHHDHGGALEEFLKVNNIASIYIQKNAFNKHINISPVEHSISIDKKLMSNKQFKLLNGDYKIDDELSLFTVKDTDRFYSYMNDSLFEDNHKDNFEHEQNLIIKENKTVLIMGCGHKGVINILEHAKTKVDYCLGGYHLYNRRLKTTVSDALLENISTELSRYEYISFYTCHCTGKYAYNFLKKKLSNINYISCGNILEI